MSSAPTNDPGSVTGRDSFDYGSLLRANLERIFNEPDEHRRLAAVSELWTSNPVMYDPNEVFRGREAIVGRVSELQAHVPAGTMFTPAGTAMGHHGVAALRWSAAIPGSEPHLHGMDLAFVVDGRIDSLYVFMDN